MREFEREKGEGGGEKERREGGMRKQACLIMGSRHIQENRKLREPPEMIC